MNLLVDAVNPQIQCVRLTGRLDMPGSSEIDLRFTALTTTDDKHVIVDLAGVDFMASIGMRLLISCAKAKAQRGGQMLLVNPQPMVREALEMAGIDSLIPIHADEAAALAALQA
jgi:anti-anti-sigma factor